MASGFYISFIKYIAFFSGAFKSQISYHLATVMGFFGSLLLVVIQFFLWSSLIGSGVRQGITVNDIIAFVILTEAVSALTRGNFANELGDSIRDGSVVMHFLRPVSYQLYLFSVHTGKNVYRLVTQVIPVVILCALVIGLPPPPDFSHLIVFMALTLSGVIIMFQLIYITGLLAFWTQATWYLSWYLGAGVTFFGGTVVPLWFYPRFLERLTVYLPFRYISFEGINYYLGKASLENSMFSLCVSFSWVLLLFLIGQLIWIKAQRKITINGG
ncbi:MAG: ABC-2 family transporter protein [Treponema sp.]|nr:ABC-2 family transporter protein [Treponema sp.]